MFFNKNEITVKIDKKLFDEVSKLEGNPNPSFVINLVIHKYLQRAQQEVSSIPQSSNIQSGNNSIAYSENYYKVQKNLQTWLKKQSDYKSIIVTYFECKETFGDVNKEILEENCRSKGIKNFTTYFSQLSSTSSSQGQIFEKGRDRNLYVLDEVKGLITDFYNNTLNNTAVPDRSTNVAGEAGMTKSTAIKLFLEKGCTISSCCTFASLNSVSSLYWANPNPDFLNNSWSLILNNKKTKQLYLLNIPANSFTIKDFNLKKGVTPNLLINITDLIDTGPGKVNFSKYVIDKINY